LAVSTLQTAKVVETKVALNWGNFCIALKFKKRGLLSWPTNIFPWKNAVNRLWKKMEEDFNFGKLGKDLKQVIFCGERKRMKQE